MSYKIAVLPGDGIGPETIRETAPRARRRRRRPSASRSRPRSSRSAATRSTATASRSRRTSRAAVKAADAVLKGAVGGPKWDTGAVRPEMGLLALRAELEVFANVRPVRRWTTRTSSPLQARAGRGHRHGDPPRADRRPLLRRRGARRRPRSRHLLLLARRGRAHRAPRLRARAQRRGKLCSVDKQNVLSSSKHWRAVVLDVAADYPDVELSHQLVDSMAMKLVEQPAAYDVIVTENMFGDILSDLAASVGGGIGLAPSSSLGAGRPGLYEAIHGSAPDIAGTGRANPDRHHPVRLDDAARPRRDRRRRRRRVQCHPPARRGPGHARTSAARVHRGVRRRRRARRAVRCRGDLEMSATNPVPATPNQPTPARHAGR